VKAEAEALVTIGIRRIIHNNPQHTNEVAGYFRAVGGVFKQMSTTSSFTPDMLVGAINVATAGLQAGLPQDVLDVKDAVIGLFKLFYADRWNAELSPEKWPANVADVFWRAIHQALIDSSLPGVP